MKKRLGIAAITAMMAASPALAQNDDTGNPAPEETVKSVQGDWQVRCGGVEDGCFMYQLVPVLETRTVNLAEFTPLIDNPGDVPTAAEIDALIPQIKDGTLTRKAVVSRGLNAGGSASYRILEGGDIIAAAQQGGMETLDITFSVPMMEFRVVGLQDRENVVAGITVTTPLRTLLPEGIQVQIDNGNVQRYQFTLCDPGGCIVQFGLTQNGLDAFKRGNSATVRIVSAERRNAPVNLNVSLKGFTAAFKDLSAE